ncbi:MerR family transcriptional regulator [Paenibacillus sp. P13VS]|uniref:MerR family transcriptional regulator n=1 Tax=Paenibacillus sp. P13VS TaxID=2697367 RepID=UPI00187B647D|nr:MerR family transcriptional regulator [Paenibacillus sp. P13VS]MBE7680120.1 MerR family transcriptional regulator [Paenibacillus sp. P13VS]
MKFYSTGEVAKKLNISVRTLRYYDQIGLMTPSQKDNYGKRFYEDEDLLTLQKITILKMLNLSLSDIGKILSKITIEQLLHAHKKSLQQKREELNNSIKSTNTILNIIHMEGNLNWKQLIPLILAEQKKIDTDMKWNEYFDQQEQVILREKLPNMVTDNPKVRHWININRRVELCLKRGDTPDSIEAQIIAEEALELSKELFDGNEELGDKFFEIRKSPEKSRDLNLYPVKEEVLHFIDEATQFYLDRRNDT